MLKKKELSVAVGAALGIYSAALLPNLAYAQDSGSTSAAEDMMIEEVVVTGSRIARKDFVSSSPVQTIGAEQISLQGTVNVEQLLNQMPQVVPGLTNTSNNPGDGTASVDLRGLGAQRTLVLVNGKRMTPTSTSGIVDINNIPASLIERVEVVTGGASAVYGSDAIAGVVNFVMKSDFEGVQFDSIYQETEENDGSRYDLGLTIGSNFDDDRGNATMYFGYSDRDDVFAGDRDFSAVALGDAIGDDPYLYPFGSSGIPGTRVFGDATFNGVVNGGGARFLEDGSAVPYDGATDTYNFAPVNYLQLPQERYTFNGFVTYNLTDNVSAYGEGYYINHETPQQLAPTPAQLTNLDFAYAASPFLTDQAKQMFSDSYDEDGDGVATLARLRRRLIENDVRASKDRITTGRILVGLKGQFADNWDWDVYYNWGNVDRTTRLTGDAAGTRLTAALNTVDGVTCVDPNDTSVVIPGCVAANIWGEGNISQDAVDYINVGATNTVQYTQHYFGGTISGTAYELPAGDLGVAFGAEYRQDDAEFTPDEFLASGDVLGFNSGEPTEGSYDVTEYFAEVNVPILAEKPFANYLGVTGAFRYSDYSTIDDVNSYAYGVEWRPVEELLIRGQYQRAVRAPNVNELFAGQANNFPSYTDPCAGGVTGDLRNFCIASGIPASRIDNFEAADSQVESTSGGNPDLTEEESDTYTAGIVWTPSMEMLEGLTITVDWYSIEVDDAIDVLGGGANNLIQTCYGDGRSLSSPECQTITRDSTGDIVNVLATNANISQFKTEGIDYQIQYGWEWDKLGIMGDTAMFQFSLLGNYIDEFYFIPSAGQDKRECAGRFGSPCGQTITGTALPDNTLNTSLTYFSGPLTVRLGWVWLDEVDDTRLDDGTAANQLPVPTLDDVSYWELSGRYAITDYAEVSVGVDNLTDEDPPKYGDASVQSNTDPSTYDVLGRSYWAGVTIKF